MKHKLTLASLMAASCLLLTSCGTDDPAKKHFKLALANQFTFVTTASADTVTAPLKGAVEFDFDDDNTKATIRIDGLVTSDEPGAPAQLIEIADVPYTINDHNERLAEAVLSGSQASVREVKFYTSREADNTTDTYIGVYLSVTFDDGTRATFYPAKAYGFGATETTNRTSADKFVSTSTFYAVEFDAARREASLTISKAAFAEQMPALGDMLLKSADESGTTSDIALSLSHDGYTLSAPLIIPSIGGTPYPRYAITDLKAEAKGIENRLDLQFNCMSVFEVNAVVTALDTPELQLK